MIVEWNDRALASVEQQRETYHSAARGYTRTGQTHASLVGMVYRGVDSYCLIREAKMACIYIHSNNAFRGDVGWNRGMDSYRSSDMGS